MFVDSTLSSEHKAARYGRNSVLGVTAFATARQNSVPELLLPPPSTELSSAFPLLMITQIKRSCYKLQLFNEQKYY